MPVLSPTPSPIMSEYLLLKQAVRPHILELPAYFTSTSDEFEPRAPVLLDANENALGSPFDRYSFTEDGPAFSTLVADKQITASLHLDTTGILELKQEEYLLDHVQDADTLPHPFGGDRSRQTQRSIEQSSSPIEAPSSAGSNDKSLDTSSTGIASSFTSCNTVPDCMLEDECLSSLHRYPSAAQLDLRRRIAEWKGVEGPQNVCLGVGAADLIDAMIRITCTPSHDAILITPPTFGLYQARAALNDVATVSVPLRLQNDDFIIPTDSILAALATNPRVRLVFLANPGNPTGSLIPLETIRQILASGFTGLVVVDEAYIDFAPDDAVSDSPASPTAAACTFSSAASVHSALSLLPEFPNLVVLHTLSKTLGLAGLRLGMAFAHPFLIQQLSKIQTPYCVSSPTAHLALRALDPSVLARRARTMQSLKANRTALERNLEHLRASGLPIGALIGRGCGNFVTVPVLSRDTVESQAGPGTNWTSPLSIGRKGSKTAAWRRGDVRARDLVRRLKIEHGIAIRYIGDAWGCSGCVRLTVGTAAENAMVCGALVAVLGLN